MLLVLLVFIRYIVISSFLFLWSSACQFLRHEVCLLAFVGVTCDEVWKEEYFKHNEDYEQFYGNNEPERAPEGHLPETVIIEIKGPFYVIHNS